MRTVRRVALGVGIWLALELLAGLALAMLAPAWVTRQMDTLASFVGR